jgi:hypothetical protein
MLPSEWDQQFKQDMVMEWFQVYINFIAIQSPLGCVASVYAHQHEELFTCNSEKVRYKELSEREQQRLENSYHCVIKMNMLGRFKARAFFLHKKAELSLCCLRLSKVLQ